MCVCPCDILQKNIENEFQGAEKGAQETKHLEEESEPCPVGACCSGKEKLKYTMFLYLLQYS